MAIIFAILAFIFFVGWLKWKIATHAMVYFIEKKGTPSHLKKKWPSVQIM